METIKAKLFLETIESLINIMIKKQAIVNVKY